MSGSGFGKQFSIHSFGESHGAAIGVVVEGCPAGLPLTEDDFTEMLARRRPNGGTMSTKRKEADAVEILSGVYEGKTTGTPIALITRNADARSQDYDAIKDLYRPGHADLGYDLKYGFRDPRGGGRSSGRETWARVAAGAIAKKILASLHISCKAELSKVGALHADDTKAVEELLKEVKASGDSLGGMVTCRVTNLPAGLGAPVFDKLDAVLSHAVFSIGAVKAVEIGDGFAAAGTVGSMNNDEITALKGDKPTFASNHAGGILGGISNGDELILRAHFKPTPSIAGKQHTVDKDGNAVELKISGRHDPIIAARGAVVVEAMVAITLVDFLLQHMHDRMDNLIDFYS